MKQLSIEEELKLEGVFKEEDILQHESFLNRSDTKTLEQTILGRRAPRLLGYRTRYYNKPDGSTGFILVKEGTPAFKHFYAENPDGYLFDKVDGAVPKATEVPLEPAN